MSSTSSESKRLALGVAAGVAAGAIGAYLYTKLAKDCCAGSGSEAKLPTSTGSTAGLLKAGDAEKSGAIFSDPNDPRDEHGRVHHLHVGNGDVAPRVLSVGDAGRAERISKLLDTDTPVNKITSSRGFITYTGNFKGVPVSIIATGMGLGQADFVIRETRAVNEGPMAIMRFGTCGGLNNTPTGSIVVASEGSVYVLRQPDLFGAKPEESTVGSGAGAMTTTTKDAATAACPYYVSSPILPDKGLSDLLFARMSDRIETDLGKDRFPVMRGMDATADSFYGSQGRKTRFFEDRNTDLISRLEADNRLSSLRTLQMETALFFDLARTTAKDYPMYASACAVVLANRHGNAVLSKAELIAIESVGGRACLEALTGFVFPAAGAGKA